MDSTAVDRRSAHRRVGAATILAFLALLLIVALRGPAEASSTVPAVVPAAPPSAQPVQPRAPMPGEPDRDFRRDHDRRGPRGGGGFDGGGGGGGTAPAPSTGGDQT
jgi:hypothetical protein